MSLGIALAGPVEPIQSTRDIPLRATFDVFIEGVGVIYRCRYVVHRGPPEREAIYGPSVQDRKTGGWPLLVKFDQATASRILELVRPEYQAIAEAHA